jgi:gas vesicle protein
VRIEDRDDYRYSDSGGMKVAVAFALGLTIGAGAALLFAPQSGAETRAEISRRARKARRAAAELAEQAREKATTAYGSARREVGRRVRQTKDGVDEVLHEVKARVDAGREAGKTGAKAAREELQRRLADMRTEGDNGGGEAPT